MRVGSLLRLLVAAAVFVEGARNVSQSSDDGEGSVSQPSDDGNVSQSSDEGDENFNQESNDSHLAGPSENTQLAAAGSLHSLKGILLLLKSVAAIGEQEFLGALQSICKAGRSEHEHPEVCDGYMKSQYKAIIRVVRQARLYEPTSKIFCNAVFGLCPIPRAKQFVPSVQKPREYSRPETSGKTLLKVVHFSDMNIDPHYTVGASTDCNRPICCRSYDEDDAPGVTMNPAGIFGHHNCDTPVSLEKSMYDAIHRLVPDVAFTLFTGNIMHHAAWNTTKKANAVHLRAAMGRMDDNLDVVYGTVGNLDSSPANLYPSSRYSKGIKPKARSSKWVYELFEPWWTKWAGNLAIMDTRTRGAYWARFMAGHGRQFKLKSSRLKVIALNTNHYYRYNFDSLREPMEKDPSKQWDWLAYHLDTAEADGERVWITGHSSFGHVDTLHDSSWTFNKIVNRYSHLIGGMFFGHTLQDHFELHYRDYDNRNHTNARAVSYMAPSLTPLSGMPSFRVYHVDMDTWGIIDVVQYVADMEDPGWATEGPKWKKYYSAQEIYGPLVPGFKTDGPFPHELSPAFWHNVTEVLQRNETAFDEYIARKTQGWNVKECRGKCRDDEICRLRAGRASNNCYDVGHVPPKQQLKRDGGGAAEERDGLSFAATVLRGLATDKATLRKLKGLSNKLGASINATTFSAERGWF
ncbi:hypothetical protein ISF_01329 [Cordyceps fumosorosea ARSEF 2679]|uniref:Sphingomyelin phosphodiesterase n=1 Tax=Cordyceps fumosorosea (strain ARSEF 2679) TaxID=1081104 RepID=A0A168D7G3_CORFA|nr:hypothetical protein ISF_01329 [Cordyceps fumosorosea ARSEF 2679]OAA72256.1 hypothetical protein ISF_01329 [Cordyceps fumosorosea ARSEF 2679]